MNAFDNAALVLMCLLATCIGVSIGFGAVVITEMATYVLFEVV